MSKTNIEINLVSDMTSILKQDMTEFGYDVSSIQNENVFTIYNELLMRLVRPIPREVKFSKEFDCPKELKGYLEQLVNKINEGKSVNQYLSRQILNISYDDKMLYDWNINHFHLNDKEEENGLIKGSSTIAFVYITDSTIYFIQTYKHGQWANKEVLDIIEKNWPFLIENHIDAEPEFDLNNEDVLNMRKNNINTILKTSNGNTCLPIGGGYTANGSSNIAVLAAINMRDIMEEKEKTFLNQLPLDTDIVKLEMTRCNDSELIVNGYNASGEIKYSEYIEWKTICNIYPKFIRQIN